MNNSTSNEDPYQCPLTHLVFVLNYQLIPVLSGLGILTNTYCVIVFSRIIYLERPSNLMFKYLLVKAIHDDAQFLIQVFAPLYTCTTCSTYQSYSMQIWFIYFFTYVQSAHQFCSNYLELFATFDCLISIKNKWQFLKKNVYFYSINIVLLVYSFSYYTFYIFYFRIVELTEPGGENETSREYFAYEYTDFTYSSIGQGLRLWHSLSNDVIPIFILIFLNILILIQIRQSVRKKLMILGRTQSHSANHTTSSSIRTGTVRQARGDTAISHARQAERNFTLSIVVSNFNFFIGHFPVFVHAIILYGSPSQFKTCWADITYFLLYLIYVTPFFIYISTNKMFRNHAKLGF